MLALFTLNQLASVADHGNKLPTTTLITSGYIAIWYIQSFGYILNAYAPTIHTLIRLKSIWHIQLIEPKKLGLATATITFKLCVHYGKLLIAYSGIEYKLRNYLNV
jgi:hypothetical protein